jgi:17beta-estradiol 17-dehydrogenase / very-long-chain 3-oxoacyl-CoA reductase
MMADHEKYFLSLKIEMSLLSSCLALIVFVITFIVISWIIIKLMIVLWNYCLVYYFKSDPEWCSGPNVWAVVTGSTDGIGLAYAKAMAEKGYCVLLISRNPEKLNKVKKEIELKYKNCFEVRTLAVDFSKSNIYETIKAELQKLDEIHVLINNVGMTYRYPEYFTRIEDSENFITSIINVNINSCTRLIHMVLPQMVEKKRGIILNVASYSACFPTPLLAIYSGTKVYVDYFSRALNQEYSEKGIIIQSVIPYYVSTPMIRSPKQSFMIPSADKFVKCALKTVGFESRTFGYFPHTVVAFLQNFVVKFLIGNDINIKLAFRKMKRFRERYLIKKNKYTQKCSDSIV